MYFYLGSGGDLGLRVYKLRRRICFPPLFFLSTFQIISTKNHAFPFMEKGTPHLFPAVKSIH